LKTLARAVFALLMGAVTLWSFHIPPALDFQQPQLARIFLWHFPCPMIATVILLIGAWFSFRYLRTGDRQWDERAAAANELGYLFCLLTMATGILFSEVQWGAWWQWDPRQTSFLMVLFVYAAYFGVRGAYSDAERRAANSAAYCLTALLPAMFLIYGYPRLPQIQSSSFHPTNSIFEGRIKGEYLYAMLSVLTLVSLLCVWLYRMRVRAGLLEIESEKIYERLAIRGGDSAAPGVVRPISLSSEG